MNYSNYRLGDVADLYRGLPIPRDRTNISFEVPYLHYGDLYKIYVNFLDLDEIYDSIIKIQSTEKIKDYHYLKTDDVVINLTSENYEDLGKSIYIKNKNSILVAGMETTVIRFKKEIEFDPLFLKYYFDTRFFYSDIMQYVRGMKVFRVNPKDLKLAKLPLIPMDLQKRIADRIYNLDLLISINNKINSNLEELAQALYKRWFVEFEFPNEEGKPYKSFGGEMVESELGLIPKGWEIKRLGDYFPILTGKKNANIATETGQYKFFTCSREIYHTDDYSFDAEAILVAGNGDFNVKYYKGKFEAYQRTYVLIPYNSSLTGLLYYAVKKNLSLITAGSRGSVISFITKGNIEDYQIVMPEDDKLYDLSKIFYDYLSLTATNNSESEKLSATRDLLLPKLMSGEIEV